MNFTFQFTSTHQDLLDAYEAQERSRLGMRSWVRACVLGVGVMWLAGVIAFTQKAVAVGKWWQPAAWLFLGSAIVWRFWVQPALMRRRICTTTPPVQPLVLTFSDSGLHVDAGDVGVFNRTWDEFLVIEPAEKGVTMGFADGMVHWLPNRVFRADEERQSLIEYVIGKMPQEP